MNLIYTKNEIYYGKTWELRYNTCARGVIEYRLVWGTRVLYDKTTLSWGLDLISLKCMKNMKTVYQDENNVVLDENSVEWKPCINRESKSLDLTIYLYGCHDINMKLLVVVTPPYIYQIVLMQGYYHWPDNLIFRIYKAILTVSSLKWENKLSWSVIQYAILLKLLRLPKSMSMFSIDYKKH